MAWVRRAVQVRLGPPNRKNLHCWRFFREGGSRSGVLLANKTTRRGREILGATATKIFVTTKDSKLAGVAKIFRQENYL